MSSTLTVGEATELRNKLQKDIESLMKKFTKDSGLYIDNIYLQLYSIGTDAEEVDRHYSVTVEVRI